jgi:hypothetical protein
VKGEGGAAAVRGPVSGDDLRRLAQTGSLLPEELVWPVGWEPLNAIPAEAALRFPEPPPLAPAAGEAPRPPFPAWLPDLAAALRSGTDPATLSVPAVEAWLADVRRSENPSSSGKE